MSRTLDEDRLEGSRKGVKTKMARRAKEAWQSKVYATCHTGCSLNIVFLDFKIYSGLRPLGFPSVSMSVHNGRSNTSAAAAELAEFRKNHNILRKNTLFNEHPVVYKRTTRDESLKRNRQRWKIPTIAG